MERATDTDIREAVDWLAHRKATITHTAGLLSYGKTQWACPSAKWLVAESCNEGQEYRSPVFPVLS